jgi:hypothetical protein
LCLAAEIISTEPPFSHNPIGSGLVKAAGDALEYGVGGATPQRGGVTPHTTRLFLIFRCHQCKGVQVRVLLWPICPCDPPNTYPTTAFPVLSGRGTATAGPGAGEAGAGATGGTAAGGGGCAGRGGAEDLPGRCGLQSCCHRRTSRPSPFAASPSSASASVLLSSIRKAITEGDLHLHHLLVYMLDSSCSNLGNFILSPVIS